MSEFMQPGQAISGGGGHIKEALKTIITPEFRVSFPCVLRKGKPMSGNPEDAKFSLVMLFALGANLQNLVEEMLRAIVDEFGPDKTKWPTLKNPFRDQKEKTFAGYVPGAIFITATSKNPPGLVDADVHKIIDESKFYAGCYGIAEVRAFIYDVKGVKGVAFGLNNVQKTRDGEPLSGRLSPEEVFSPITPPAGAAGGSKPMTAADIFSH